VAFKDHQLYGDYGSQTIPLGITGIHANEYRNRHELFVVAVGEDGPAQQRVRPGDIILDDDRSWFDARIKALAEEEAQCRATQRMGRGLETSLVRLDLARRDLRDDYAALSDLALVIEAAGAPKCAPQTVAELCRIYTHRGWRKPNDAITQVLKRGGSDYAPAIRAAIAQARAALDQAAAERLACLSNTVKSRYKWRYDRACALEERLVQGITSLREVLRRIE